MIGKFFDNLLRKTSLLDDARQEALLMLVTDRRMFDLVMMKLADADGKSLQAKIRGMDKEINQHQTNIRTKVFEHLTFTKGEDLVSSLELITAVVDLERIGDYTKNITELADMMPTEGHFGEHHAVFDQIHEQVNKLFEETINAFSKNDLDAARSAMDRYQKISNLCENNLALLLKKAADTDALDKNSVAMVLLLRYLKRVAAHLKNMSSALVNPFQRIGYRM